MGASAQRVCGCQVSDKATQRQKSNIITRNPSGTSAKSTDAEALDDFKMFLTSTWNRESRAEAFKNFSDYIDKTEFTELFVEQMGYDGDIDRAFELLDIKKDGFIRKSDLRILARSSSKDGVNGSRKIASGSASKDRVGKKTLTGEQDAIIKTLLEKMKKKANAIENLGGSGAFFIDEAEFSDFLRIEIGYTGSIDFVLDYFQIGADGLIGKNDVKKLISQANLLAEEVGSAFRRSSTEPTQSSFDDNDSLKKKERRASESDIAVNSELLDFQVYFHRRPLRVEAAFANLQVENDENVSVFDFTKFVSDRLQYNGDPIRIFNELSKNLDRNVTWADIKTTLELEAVLKKLRRPESGTAGATGRRPTQRKSTRP